MSAYTFTITLKIDLFLVTPCFILICFTYLALPYKIKSKKPNILYYFVILTTFVQVEVQTTVEGQVL